VDYEVFNLNKMKLSNFLKSSFLLFLVILSSTESLRPEEDDSYGENLDTLVETYNRTNKLYSSKQKEYFSNYYEKADDREIIMNTSNLMKGDETTKKSFRKLNAIANNVIGGDRKLKNNAMLKNTLKLMLNNNNMKAKQRVDAAKLASRLNDMPVSIQVTSNDPNKKPTNLNSYVIVPRIKRIYRPDYYVENYKAGNWDA
jgi:hypothetical protein